jgi:hypothetical protein
MAMVIGALNIYSREPREWSDADIAVSVVLANVATSYVLNAVLQELGRVTLAGSGWTCRRACSGIT